MKSGLSQDSEGEIIDYNKTDAALRSIGISIKDAQGQFRDFDDVIFELSEAWDGLDKNTQRYIATVMAKLKRYWSFKTSLIAGTFVNTLLLSGNVARGNALGIVKR